MEKNQSKKIYLSGKISDLPHEEAVANFNLVERKYIKKGYKVVNPMKLKHNHDKTWQSYMREDIKALMDCDTIVMIPNWKSSEGACIEFNLAVNLGLNIIFEK